LHAALISLHCNMIHHAQVCLAFSLMAGLHAYPKNIWLDLIELNNLQGPQYPLLNKDILDFFTCISIYSFIHSFFHSLRYGLAQPLQRLSYGISNQDFESP